MTRTLSACCCAGFIALTSSARPSAQMPTFSSRVDTIRVDALVTAGGQPIVGLRAADFEILDNGVAQQVDLVTFEQLPVNLILTLDLSGSIGAAGLAQLRAGARGVLDAIRRDDRSALLTFNAAVRVRAALTSDVAAIERTLDQPSTTGDTSLIDATYAALLLGESESARALVIVFSDGADTGSFLRPESVLASAKRMDAVLYGVALGEGGHTAFLRQISAATGGRMLTIESAKRLRETFLHILEEFRQRYVISYSPRGVSNTGWHRIDVRVKTRRAVVRARPGYQGGS